MQIDRYRGDNYADSLVVKENGSPVNLTGCTFKLTVSTSKTPADAAEQLYQLDGIVEDPTTGVVMFQPSLSQADKVGFFYFDIQMTDSNGIVRTLTNGVYNFVQDITK